MMARETGFHEAAASDNACLRINPRGARHLGRTFAPQTNLYAAGSVLDPDHDAVMRIGGEAPGGGPILFVGICATSATGSRHLGSSIRQSAESQRECRMVLSVISSLGKALHAAGRKTTPSSGSPVVTKRQSAMISLRASATIIVLCMPTRLSAVRARYHSASALCF